MEAPFFSLPRLFSPPPLPQRGIGSKQQHQWLRGLGSEVAPPLGVVKEEVAVLIALVRGIAAPLAPRLFFVFAFRFKRAASPLLWPSVSCGLLRLLGLWGCKHKAQGPGSGWSQRGFVQ